MATWWLTGAEGLFDVWPDAGTLDQAVLTSLLEVAKEQVIIYAPAGTPTEGGIPERLALAQLRQAQNIHRAITVDGGGQIGDGEGYAITTYPLDWHVKNLIRPKRGRISVR